MNRCCALIFGTLLIALAPPLLCAEAKMEPTRPVPLSPAEGERQGKALVADLLSRRAEPTTKTGLLKIRDAKRRETQLPIRFQVIATDSNTVTTYETLTNNPAVKLVVVHTPDKPNQYRLAQGGSDSTKTERELKPSETMVPFAGSDFWIADLGLEFLHWPQQRVLRKEMRRSQFCSVLESTNPNPNQNYSKLVSWVEVDSGGIVHADAYDTKGAMLKLFDPTELQKVQGIHEVKEVEMRNRQTGSRSWIEFNLPD